MSRTQVLRGLLGGYLCWHFVALLPWAAELFSSQGMLPDGALSPLLHAFPNLLAWHDEPSFVRAFVALGVAASMTLATGVYPRLSALVCYYVWACLFGRNPLIDNPSLAYVGLLLLVCALRHPEAVDEACARPRRLLWIAMALGYSYSGWTKLVSPSWLDGSALHYVLENPLARATPLRALLLALPAWILHAASYATLFAELAFAPLALFARLRPWLWTALALMHVGLLALVQFADLSLAMLLLHAFTFDPSWLSRATVASLKRGATHDDPTGRSDRQAALTLGR